MLFFFFPPCLFRGSKANNLTLRKVSAQRGAAPWRTRQRAQHVSEPETQRHALSLSSPAASVARGRFNGVIHSAERPLSGPVK